MLLAPASAISCLPARLPACLHACLYTNLPALLLTLLQWNSDERGYRVGIFDNRGFPFEHNLPVPVREPAGMGGGERGREWANRRK